MNQPFNLNQRIEKAKTTNLMVHGFKVQLLTFEEEAFKQLIAEAIAYVTPERGRDYSQDNTGEAEKQSLLMLQSLQNDLIDEIETKTKELLGNE